ncbi:hypothetical protein ACN077_25770 [Clostridium chromiireducens]
MFENAIRLGAEQYFEEYYKANPKHQMKAFDNVNYCLGAKKKF